MKVGGISVPFLSLLFPYALGLIASFIWDEVSFELILTTTLVCFGGFVFIHKSYHTNKKLTKGIFFILLFAMGFFVQYVQNSENDAHFIKDTSVCFIVQSDYWC